MHDRRQIAIFRPIREKFRRRISCFVVKLCFFVDTAENRNRRVNHIFVLFVDEWDERIVPFERVHYGQQEQPRVRLNVTSRRGLWIVSVRTRSLFVLLARHRECGVSCHSWQDGETWKELDQVLVYTRQIGNMMPIPG